MAVSSASEGAEGEKKWRILVKLATASSLRKKLQEVEETGEAETGKGQIWRKGGADDRGPPPKNTSL